ncbi:MAG: hypothetical protein F4Y64_06795 [Rhodothermaceae bacterium]|nr:hypothetical protein [Rhodothermaceae bacterium]MXZ58870.1 hypothetical protein [Rhodothermaceae bacterium]
MPILITIAEKLLNRPPDETEKKAIKEIAKAIGYAQLEFHKHFGDDYGMSGSTFIDREINHEKLLLSTFARGERLTTDDLVLEGFDESPEVPVGAADLFIEKFYDAIDQTRLRALDRDLSLQKAAKDRSEILKGINRIEGLLQQRTDVKVGQDDPGLETVLNKKNLPSPILAAIIEPSLDGLSKLMKEGEAKDALAYAQRYINAIDAAIGKDNGSKYHSVVELRTYRQRLLFAAASAACWQGDIESGREYWWRAHKLGAIAPEWHEQAVITLFNVGLKDELQHFMKEMDKESEVYRKTAAPCLAYLKKDWYKIDELLADVQSADQILHRVEARLYIIDAKDAGAVELTADLLLQTDGDITHAIVNLKRAQLTLDLFKRVITEYTPLDYDRGLLANNLIDRIDVALETAENDSFFRAQALGCLRMVAELLRDRELNERFMSGVDMLDEEIRSSVFPLYGASSPLNKIHLLQSEGHFDANMATILKAEFYQDSALPENIEAELYEALFASVEKEKRKYALRLLAQHLRRTNRTEEARRLIDAIPLRPAENWLVRAENLPTHETPLDIVNEVDAFPLDVDVVEHLAQFTLSAVKSTSPESAPPDETDLNYAEEAVYWTTRLVEILPSRSSRFLYAQALYVARRYEELLTISQDLDPIYAEKAAEFEAWALIGLGRTTEAIDCFISASNLYPESIHFVVNAGRFLLIENRPEKAAILLEPHINSGSQDPDILLIYAQSIHDQAPGSQEHASIAFDLLAQAYNLQPDPNIAQKAWHTARAAGREQEAERYFDAMIAEMPVKVVVTEDDFSQAMLEAGENRGVWIKGGLEFLANMVQEDRERSEFLGKLLRAHALSYTDFFHHSGRSSWEIWTYWTQQFQKRGSKGQKSFRDYFILTNSRYAHSRYDQQRNDGDTKLFLDQTAILTLGVLGPKTANQILIALGESYVHSGISEELGRDITRINEELLTSNAIPQIKAVHFFRQRPDSIVPYSREIEAEAPDNPSLGPCRVDLGVAVLYDALYVTDLGNSDGWPEEANRLRISSAVLLASLNEAGEVTTDEAMDVSKKHSNAFKGWNTETPRPIPEAIVFDEYSILAWVDSGLANVLGNRVKVGPWAWIQISEQAERQEAMELACERLKDTRRVLQAALDEGILVKIEAGVNTETPEDATDKPSEEALPIEKLWLGAIKSLRTAQSQGLQLWADDRFYSLLLSFGGPKNMGTGVNEIRDPFVDWGAAIPPISTLELLNQVSSVGHLPSTVAQDAAAKLFSQGYRIVPPLILTHTLRQYPVPISPQLTPPFQELVHAITEIPEYFTETFNDLYGNRDGFIRLVSNDVAGQFIVSIWETDELGDDERSALANAFLEAVESVFEEVTPKPTESRFDLTRFSFWRGVIIGLQTIQDHSKIELRYDALRWFGKAVAQRDDKLETIVRVLEDNVLDSLNPVLKILRECNEMERLSQAIAAYVVPGLTPLTDTELINALDPLMRRTIGFLAQLDRDGRINTQIYATSDREGTLLEIPEEQKESAAAEVVWRAVSGDSDFQRLIHATDVVFSYSHQVPVSWIDAGFPAEEELRIKVRCSLFSLIWNGPPELQEVVIHFLIFHLSSVDPALAYLILLQKDALLSGNPEKTREARDIVAIELLQSGYFDLQRNLVHAVRRFNQYDADAFSQFIGWIGEEAAQALANHQIKPKVWQIGSLLVPIEHFIGRALLTELFDDGNLVLEHIERLINAGDDQDTQNTTASELTEWLEDKVRAAENANDPFVAAWALRAVLLSLSTVNQDLELNINGHAVKVLDWATNYITIALAPNVNQPSEIEQRMIDRRQLASAALLLASFICSGHKHREAFDQVEDPRAIWLEHVWLMATKLQIALIGLMGGLSNAAESATKAVQELDLDTADVPIIDAFDPFAFGLNGDDIGIALTLTAILKVVRQLPNNNERPTWWSNTIQSLVEELASVGSDKILPNEEEVINRFGLAAPLRVQLIAQQLIKSLPT